jgi:trehalose 6-phosphate synthase/phosphatase
MKFTTMNERLLIVSNRLPVQFSEIEGSITAIPSAGGLVSCIKSFLKKPGKHKKDSGTENAPVWIGAVEISEKKFNANQVGKQLTDQDFKLAPVFLPSLTHDKFYNGFCNDTIWPLFHYFPSYAKFRDDYFEHYVLSNQLFCEKIAALYRPGDIIWIHDYHLMLLPGMLRRKLPDAMIGFFLHIPFPSFELFRMLPGSWRKDILEGMLGADLVGFHTNTYAQHFLKSVTRLLGYENALRSILTHERSVMVDIFPVGIDYSKFQVAMSRPEIFSERNRIRKRLNEVQLIISVDRLDYTKGIVNRLEGFELFLKEHSEYAGKVSFIMVIVPSRDIISKYKEIKETIEGLVGRINGKFGTLDWVPIVYQYKAIDFRKLAGLYVAADVALITPIRDGMNLVAKEFVASRSDKRGVLILSETAGAASELGEAIIINPTDRREVANALLQALTMPLQEQVMRNEFMQKRLKNYDVIKWADDFIAQLFASRAQQETLKVKILSKEGEKIIRQHYSKTQKRLLLLDYDGTLTPIVRYPHLAAPTEEVIELLNSLADDDRNTVVIISGRSKDTMQEWFGNMPVNLVAEHGAYFKRSQREWQQSLSVNADWKEIVRQAMAMLTDRCPGSFIEEKEFALAWHYRNADTELGFLKSRELFTNLNDLTAHLDFQVVEGRKVIEARPRGIDKGTAALIWLSVAPYDFIFAVGDDRTDEDMFRVIPPDAYSIRVGLIQSAARFNLNQQKDLLTLLSTFLAVEPEYIQS